MATQNLQTQIQQVLQNTYDRSRFIKEVLVPVFGSAFVASTHDVPELLNDTEQTKLAYAKQYASVALAIGTLKFYEVRLQPNVRIERSRVIIQQFVRRLLNVGDAALISFVPQEGTTWRFTLVARDTVASDTEGVKEMTTYAKRYTYLLGNNETCRTAAERLTELANMDTSLDNIIRAFSVEKLSKEFFAEYKRHYEKFVAHILQSNAYKTTFNANDKDVRDFCKKLLGRLVFLYFVQKKGWLGNNLNFIDDLFRLSGSGEGFYYNWLHALFFEALNKKRPNNDFIMPDDTIVSIPFLNGGLFDKDKIDEKAVLTFSPHLFSNAKNTHDLFGFDAPKNRGFLDFLNAYNFTVHEDSPDDHTVAVDPEMLGHIFENLLEDNKDKGAFYTPKEIVHYMCQESLIEYLATALNTERDQFSLFIRRNQTNDFIEKKAIDIEKALDSVKICDPAIGSGAFPMGILHEIFEAKELLAFIQHKPFDAATTKRNIIQNSIYGVDIEQGAVDIARLRFWLSLVVDENEPKPLPNLDYKIMQGNSLLENFEGIDLSILGKEVTNQKEPLRDLFGNFINPQQALDFSNQRVAQQTLAKLTPLSKTYFSEQDGERKIAIKNEINTLVNNHISQSISSTIKELDKRLNEFENVKESDLNTKKRKEIEQMRAEKERLEFAAIELKTLKPNEPKPFFLWHLFFKDVFDAKELDKGGFDIIIGNPPYVKEPTNRNAFNGLRDSKYYMGKMDIWYFFACYCIDLLKKDKGIECFIAQNNWITSSGAAILRDKILQETEILAFVDFGNYKVFQDSASIQTMIYILKKGKPKSTYNTQYSRLFIDNMDKSYLRLFLDEDSSERDEYTKRIVEIQPKSLIGNYISFNSPEIEKVLSKIQGPDSFFLTEKEIAQGIVAPQEFLNKKNAEILGTNYKEGEGIFILKSEEKEKLNFNLEEEELIKPFYTTQQLGRYYGVSENEEWIIYTTSDINRKIKEYPTIKTHLDRFKKVLTSDFAPYGLHRSRDERFFKGNKIMSVRKCIKPTFTYTNFDCYVSQTYFVIKTDRINLKYLTAILNSRVVAFWLKFKGKLQGNLYQVDKQPLIELPIVNSTRDFIIEILVDYILSIQKAGEQQIIKYIDNELMIHAIDEVINHCVFEIYFPEDLENLDLKILEFLQNIQPITSNDKESIKIVTEFYHWINEQSNPIRNKLLKSNILSKDLLTIINAHIN